MSLNYLESAKVIRTGNVIPGQEFVMWTVLQDRKPAQLFETREMAREYMRLMRGRDDAKTRRPSQWSMAKVRVETL